MGATIAHETLDEVLERVAGEAVARDVSADVVRKAHAATARALAGIRWEGSGLMRRRAEAYFGSVVRREVVLRRACAVASARLVAATVAEDLQRSGRTPADVWDELQRGWAHTIPAEVLEEYRPVARAERVAA
jgi:hypothetical protein